MSHAERNAAICLRPANLAKRSVGLRTKQTISRDPRRVPHAAVRAAAGTRAKTMDVRVIGRVALLHSDIAARYQEIGSRIRNCAHVATSRR